MAETTAWRSHCQFITFIAFLYTVNVIRQMAPLFSKVDSNKLWHVQNKENVICAQFGKDLFNISKVIGRKKVAQFFWLTVYIHCVSKNRTRILWSITFTNIGQYQYHLTELFVQQYLIIYHKNYSHSHCRVPAATITMATSATRADQRLWYYSAPAHRVRVTVEYLRHATPD